MLHGGLPFIITYLLNISNLCLSIVRILVNAIVMLFTVVLIYYHLASLYVL